MAEQIPFSIVENVLSSLGSSVAHKLGSMYGIRNELKKLEETDWSQSKPQSFIVETSMKVTGKNILPYYSGFSLFKYKKVLTNMNNK